MSEKTNSNYNKMINKKAIRSETTTIRQMALILQKEKLSLPVRSLTEDETQEHVYELEVHQVELELQIEAFILESSFALKTSNKYKDASEKYKDACDKYTELYDFAPSGYFTLSKEGEIIELNIAGAKKLGKERSHLKNSQFGFFISNDTKPIFNLFLAKVFNSKERETCMVTLSAGDGIPKYIYISGIANAKKDQCFVSVIDITGLRLQEQGQMNEKEKSEEKDRIKSAFLANLSDEIKTPMNSILSYTELLKKPELSVEKQQMCISMIEKGNTRMLKIINDL